MKISNANLGQSFENYFDKCLTVKGWRVTRIPDGCKVYGANLMKRVKSPFDFLCTRKPGLSFYCDTKTTIGETYPYSAINQDQVRELLSIEKNGHVAGFVINFRQVGLNCFVSAKALSEIVPGGSIKARACIDLGKEIEVDRLFSFVQTKA